jgi:hypothetical protein
MGRALGANAMAVAAFETTPGAVPGAAAAWGKIPFVSHSLGEERGLLASDLLGQGREMLDPVADVANNDGDLVVPVDVRNFGKWLKLFLGAPATTGATGAFTHVFTSGGASLPSMSLEVGAPEVPAYSVHRGVRGNQMRIPLQRSGLLNATLSMIAIGETDPVAETVGPASPTELAVLRFPQAVGYVKKDGVALGSVVSAGLTLSNDLEKIETIQPDGRIEDSDPGQVMMSGDIVVRFKDTLLLAAASTSPPTPIALEFGWVLGAYSLVFSLPRVFLPRPKRPVTGPKGIQATFNWQGSGALGHVLTATLSNDVSTY